MSLAVPPEAVYPDTLGAFTQMQEHTKEHGYALYRYIKKGNRLVFVCDCAGKYDSRGKDPSTHSSKQHKKTGSKKCVCLIRVELCEDADRHYTDDFPSYLTVLNYALR